MFVARWTHKKLRPQRGRIFVARVHTRSYDLREVEWYGDALHILWTSSRFHR